jgi:hypothetical protein
MAFENVHGYEFWVTCPECGYLTDASRDRYYDGEVLVCGSDTDGEGCGARLDVSVSVVE